jgi:pyrimidine oxygenase
MVERPKRLELGVFLPNARNGFALSSNAVAYAPSYEENLAITAFAEEIGLDYVFSMLKWKGFGGATHFWDAALESFTLTTALAAVTTRVRLIATVNPLLVHPAVMAKMASTLDHVSRGRLGLNVITGATVGEYAQMGVVPPGYNDNRYAYAAEWVQVVKRLWTQSSVTHHGEFFDLENCVSEPKPVQRPGPFLVCAASSDEGLRFTAREADYSFVSRESRIECVKESMRAKSIAADEHRTIKTAIPMALVIRDNDADADAYYRFLVDGADVGAMANIGGAHGGENRESSRRRGAAYKAPQRPIHMGLQIIGGPERIAEEILALAVDGDADSVLLTFPDYLEGLQRFNTSVMPLLRATLDVGRIPV